MYIVSMLIKEKVKKGILCILLLVYSSNISGRIFKMLKVVTS